MKASDEAKRLSSKRRRLKDVVAKEEVEKILKRLNGVFLDVRHSVPPPNDEEEARRRDEIVLRACNRILLRALAYLHEHHPAVARALAIGGHDCAEAWLRGEEAEFVVSLKAAKELPDFMLYSSLLDTHVTQSTALYGESFDY